MANKAREIENLLASSARDAGFEIVDTEYFKEDGKRIVRVYIDKEDGVNIDDCEMMSKIFGRRLDETDIVNGSYILEISSPGLYRAIKREKDYIRFIGSKVRLHTLAACNGQRNFCGTLLSFENGIAKIDDVASGIVEVEFSNIRKANLEPEL